MKLPISENTVYWIILIVTYLVGWATAELRYWNFQKRLDEKLAFQDKVEKAAEKKYQERMNMFLKSLEENE